MMVIELQPPPQTPPSSPLFFLSFFLTCRTTSGLIGAVKTAGREVWPEAVPSRPCTVTRGREAAIFLFS